MPYKSFLLTCLNKINLTLAIIIDNFAEYGTFGKILLIFLFTTPISLIVFIVLGIDRFINGNGDYIVIWFVLLISDTTSGILKHWMKHTFSGKDMFIKAMLKTFVSFCGLMIFTSFATIFATGSYAETYILLFGKVAVAVYIGESALVNLYTITGKKFPPIAFMERLKNFKEDGSIDNLLKSQSKTKS